MESAAEAVAAAERALAEARAQHSRLEAELEEGRRRLSELRAAHAAEAAPQDAVARGMCQDVRVLLDLMEQGRCQFGNGSEELLMVMGWLHRALFATNPPAESAVDAALPGAPVQPATSPPGAEAAASTTGPQTKIWPWKRWMVQTPTKQCLRQHASCGKRGRPESLDFGPS